MKIGRKKKMSKYYHQYTGVDHTFVVCAYGESPYLEECIHSVVNQTSKSKVIIATSTPNQYIKEMAEKYDLKLYVNDGEKGLAGDWNFAYRMVQTPLVTIAHQDDIYLEKYGEEVIQAMNHTKRPLIAFSDYGEQRERQRVDNNALLHIKRCLLLPMRIKLFQKSVFVRRRILSLGSAICCPAVSFYKENLPEQLFTSEFQSNSDWQAWERLTRKAGSFVYVHKILMLHRIHEESTTSKIIAEDNRRWEDIEMFKKFWPEPVARLIENIYKKSEKSNKL